MIRIIRFLDTGAETFGVMLVDQRPLGFALELAWKNNQNGVSCIPAGRYKCEWVESPSQGHVLEIQDVPGRTHILIHAANTRDELRGCVAPGRKVGELKGLPAVLESRAALEDLFARIGPDGTEIDIAYAVPGTLEGYLAAGGQW